MANTFIGNYYSWGAATAGTGVLTDETNDNNTEANTNPKRLVNANSSICPRNWQLPASGRYLNEVTYPYKRDKSFEMLFEAYGYPAGNEDAGWKLNNGYPFTSLTGNGKTRIDFSPMFFARNGNIDSTTGSIRSAGDNGIYWSNTAFPASDIYTYSLDFETATSTYGVQPSNRHSRFNGFSVRCVAK